MSSKIFYFSGSGNSYWVSKQLKEQLKGFHLERITQKLIDQKRPVNEEKLGFIFPVYAFGIPKMVKDFLKSTPIKTPDYLFSILTYAGDAANTFSKLEKLLSKKSLSLNAAFKIQMPGNYIKSVEDIDKKNEADLNILSKAPKELEKIINPIQNSQKISAPKATFKGKLKSAFIPFLFNLFSKKEARFFSYNQDCIACKVCLKICPSKNINFTKEQKPKWKNNCLFCLACLNWCPENAIIYKSKEEFPNYYHHPKIHFNELLNEED